MAYTKQTWVNNETLVDEDRMNHIENGIYQNAEDISEINQSLTDYAISCSTTLEDFLSTVNALPLYSPRAFFVNSSVSNELTGQNANFYGVLVRQTDSIIDIQGITNRTFLYSIRLTSGEVVSNYRVSLTTS